jgi:hypothetical protein
MRECGKGGDRNGTGGTPFGLSIGDLQREGGRDRDLERVAKRCDRPPGDERGMSETGRRSVTEGGDRATAVTGVRRRTIERHCSCGAASSCVRL